MNKQVDMSVFIGKKFYCEYTYTDTGVWDLHGNLLEAQWPERQGYLFRPDLNKAQVLDDWSWVPNGLVWMVTYYDIVSDLFDSQSHPSSNLRRMKDDYHIIYNASCVGVEPEYSLWGEERGMKVIAL